MTLTRRTFLQGTLAATAALLNVPQLLAAEPELAWQDVTQWGVEGRGWEDQERKRFFDRLPGQGGWRGPATGLGPQSP